jgi:hypothetical protein
MLIFPCIVKQFIFNMQMFYSPDGKMLCSQGGEPDYQVTVWNWEKSLIILRCQSYINDVYVARFSPAVPGNITTSGMILLYLYLF